MWRTRRRWMDDLAKVLFKISNHKLNSKTSWVINRIKTCIVKRDRRLLTSFSMWQNSLINRASPWELAKQLENNDARKISSIKIWNLVSQRMFQPFPHSLDRHYHWRSPNNSIKAGWGLKLSWRELPHAHRQYGMYDGICLIMSSSMRTCAENFGKLGPELKVQNYHYWSSSSSSSPALVLVSLQACSIVRPGSRHRSARSSPWGLRAWCPCLAWLSPLSGRGACPSLPSAPRRRRGRWGTCTPPPAGRLSTWSLSIKDQPATTLTTLTNPTQPATTLTGWRSLSAKSAAAAKAPLASYFGFTDCFTLNKLWRDLKCEKTQQN